MSRIFVSHSSRDQKSAEILGQWLQDQGHTSYFLDFDPDKGIAAGKHWEDELYRHLRLCRAVIALLSPNWLDSRWCFAEVTQARAAGKPIFLAKIAPCNTSGIFDDVQQVDLTADPAEGYRRLAKGLRDIGIKPGEAFEWNPSRPPYPGLLAFEEEDAAIFFGRDRDIQKGLEILDGLRRRGGPSFILCLGASGSGKSSLMRAGLIPRLRKDSKAWLSVAPCRPQENPLEELAIKLAQAFKALGEQCDWRSIYEHLYAPHTSGDWAAAPDRCAITGKGLTEVARDLRVLAGQQEATVVLAIDQAEELFGYSDAQKSRAFLQCLRGALEAGGHRLMAIATMRSDSLGSFQTHPDLQDFAYEPLTVAPVPLRDLPQIIEGPAHVADVKLEPGLVQILVQDATTSDALPLLAFTLRELYERYGQDGLLEIREYEDLGRLEGSVRRAADAVIEMAAPNAEELAALRVAFVPAMVRVNEEGDFIRRRAAWLDLPARAQALLQRFVDARLLVSRDQEGERVVEVAHEALLRVWPRLSRWLREDRDNLRILDDLRHAAEEWQTHGWEESWLVHYGDRLAAVEEMEHLPQFAGQVDQVAKGYLEACVRKRQKEQERVERERLAERKRLEAEARAAQRTRIAATVISIIALLAIGAAAFGWYQAGVAENERNHALIAQSKALSLVSRQKTDEGYATLGILLSLEALPKTDRKVRPFVSDAEASLLYALLAQREKQILRGHSEGINEVRFSPQGLRVVTASRDRTARLWSVRTGETLATLKGHEGQVNGAEFSPDGTRVVTVSSDKTARLWNVESGLMIFNLEGHQGNVYQASFSPNGKRVVTASDDQTAKLWDAETGKVIATLQGHSQSVHRASFSPDGQRIVTASWDHTARLWDGLEGGSIATLHGHQGGVDHAVFSPDGKLVATTSVDNTVRLWNSITGEIIGSLEGHQGQVYYAEFSSDNRTLATTSDDGTARIWDIASREAIAVLPGHYGPVWSASFSADGRLLATASDDYTARIWDASSNKNVLMLKGHEGYVYKAIFSSGGKRVVSISQDGAARIWDAATGQEIALLKGHEGEVWYAAFSADDQRVVTASEDGTARLWDAETGNLVATLTGHNGWVGHAHFSPDGSWVVTASEDNTARIWDVDNGKALTTLQGHNGPVNLAKFSYDGSLIVTVSDDHTARTWDAATGQWVATFAGHEARVVYAAFSPDDRRLATASRDGTARLWDTASGESLAVLRGHKAPVWSAIFSAEGRRIITTSWDNTARIWDATEGKPLFVLQGHEGRVVDGSFSPDGRWVVTASWDGTARLWHAASGQFVGNLKGHRNYVVSAAFSPDGQQVATASWDYTARVWTLPVAAGDDWVKYARDIVPRGFTDDERRLYSEQ